MATETNTEATKLVASCPTSGQSKRKAPLPAELSISLPRRLGVAAASRYNFYLHNHNYSSPESEFCSHLNCSVEIVPLMNS